MEDPIVRIFQIREHTEKSRPDGFGADRLGWKVRDRIGVVYLYGPDLHRPPKIFRKLKGWRPLSRLPLGKYRELRPFYRFAHTLWYMCGRPGYNGGLLDHPVLNKYGETIW